MSGIGSSTASGLTSVYLNNPTSVSFTQESLCLFTVGTVPCPIGWKEGEVLAAGRSNPGLYLPLQSTPLEAAKIHTEWAPNGGLGGEMTFWAIDSPLAPTIVKCYGNVPGFSCSVVDELFAYLHQDDGSSQLLGASPSADARFWSGLAPVRGGGVALVPVASYSARAQGKVRERVTLRTKHGSVIGSAQQTLRFGQRAQVEVRLTRGAARTIEAGKRIKVEASVAHADKTEGTGQTTTLTLTKLTPALAKLMH
ncbi:MAG TPA: hypothetical protein VMI13_02310 [Solirubrobacteraceae bacterium]|nr:hypothetical protein [Solirubrobacteraceae bacterium]